MSGTSGLSSGTNGAAQLLIVNANAGTATGITSPFKCLFLSVVRTANNGTDTEWSTSGGYTAGTGGAITFAAVTADATGAHQASNVAVTITNAPAVNWAGNIIKDSSATPKETWYAPLTGGTKAINAGDTCTIASGSFTSNLG